MHVSCPIHLVGPLLKAFYEQHRRDHEGMEPALRQLAEEATRLYHDNVKGAKPGWVATWEFLNRWRGWYVDIGAAARKRKVRACCLLVQSDACGRFHPTPHLALPVGPFR